MHGNHTTPDADILGLAALTVGEPATEVRLADAERRLRESGRFAGIEVRRRYRSIADPSEILVIFIVDEHDAVSADDLTPGPIARVRSATMWLPILAYTDGYGLTYGARVSFVEPFGPNAAGYRCRRPGAASARRPPKWNTGSRGSSRVGRRRCRGA